MAAETSAQAPSQSNSRTDVVANSHPRLLWPVRLFLISLTLPFFLQLGPIQLFPYRIILLVTFIPSFLFWLRGRAGPIRVADIALISMCLWGVLSFFKIHGANVALEAGGIAFLETMGAYLLARCCISSADDFYALVRFLFRLVALLLPFAVYETITSTNILLEIANKIGSSHDTVPKEPRWGFDRVQAIFSHPILFGIFCGSTPALVFYVLGYGSKTMSRIYKTTLVTFTAILSLSSGPLTSLVAQILLIGWDKALASIKSKWQLLSGGILSIVVAIEIAANRSTPEIFISYFAFNTSTATNRIRIWKFGTMSVENHPFFGIGRNDWVRPYWMSSSMDMFWLVPAVRHGLPSALLLQLAFWSLFLLVAFKKNLPRRISEYRKGYLICLVGFYLGGWTVHYWKDIYVMFIFLLGSGAWFLNEKSEQSRCDPTPSDPINPRNKLRQSKYESAGKSQASNQATANKSRDRSKILYSRFRPNEQKKTKNFD